ncbi:MAG: hypothetical protein NTW67_00375 [Candidatus Woesearchaeota archaeon]|nr:hypothetical protein [Candidatus Woesearchaeota archaeon]
MPEELTDLELTIADAIVEATSEIRDIAERKREKLQFDPSLSAAESFLNEYQQCKWKGTATESFKSDIKQHLIYLNTIGAVKKLIALVGMTGIGMAVALIGYKNDLPTVGIAGDLIGLASVAATYISFRISREKTEKVNYSIKNDSDSMNKVLRHIYAEEKCH